MRQPNDVQLLIDDELDGCVTQGLARRHATQQRAHTEHDLRAIRLRQQIVQRSRAQHRGTAVRVHLRVGRCFRRREQ